MGGFTNSKVSYGEGQPAADDVAVLSLPSTIVVEIKKVARAKHLSVASLIAGMLEDRQDAMDAEKAYRKHLKTGRKIVSADKLYRDLGLVD